MSFIEKLKPLAKKVEEEIRLYFDEIIEHVKPLGEFPLRYYSDTGDYILRGGKRLRPSLALVAYDTVKGSEKEGKGNITRASLPLEFLHNASLLHDDVIDLDELRWGKKTFHVQYKDWHIKHANDLLFKDPAHFGVSMAILAGDLVWSLGLNAFFTSGFKGDALIKAVNYFNTAYNEIIDGIILELDLTCRETEVTEKGYFEVIRLKTAVLFEKACLIGAILGSGTEKQIEALSNYAIAMGKAFQIRDDILGSFGVVETMGKGADSDIKTNKKTILLIKTLQEASKDQKKILGQVLGKQNSTPEEIDMIRDIMRETDALEYAEKKAEEFVKIAKTSLEEAEPPLEKKAMDWLIELVNFVVERAY